VAGTAIVTARSNERIPAASTVGRVRLLMGRTMGPAASRGHGPEVAPGLVRWGQDQSAPNDLRACSRTPVEGTKTSRRSRGRGARSSSTCNGSAPGALGAEAASVPVRRKRAPRHRWHPGRLGPILGGPGCPARCRRDRVP
jgi:hypothetical protein